MDYRVRSLLREVQRAGDLVPFVKEAITEMKDSERRQVMSLLDFYTERLTRWFTLSGRRFKIAKLPDSTIERLINENQCYKHWLQYLKTGVRQRGYDYSYDQPTQNIWELILDEAEHRGLMSGHQKVWKKIRDEPTVKLLNAHYQFGKRCEAGKKHDVTSVANGYTCINCRQRITGNELREQAISMLRGRLREYIC